MPRARAWRKATSPQKRTHGAATLSEDAMPTKQRIVAAGGAGGFDIRGSGMHRVMYMVDTPLEQLRARAYISEPEYLALWRYRMHWYLGSQAGSLRAIDLNRIIAINQDYGEPSSEQAIWHREMFDAASHAQNELERTVTSSLILHEYGLVATGAELGYNSPYRGRQAALELLHSAVPKIVAAWLSKERQS